MGNVFLVCLLDHSKESRKAIKHFEKLRRKEGWGEGTDGLILAWDIDDNRVRAGSADFSRASASTGGADAVCMLLFNADGGRAEISGNGLCCLGQAVARRTKKTDLVLDVTTDAGHRVVTVFDGTNQRSQVSATMGVPVVGRPDVNHSAAEAVQEFAIRAVFMDAGNPHLVAQVEDLDSIDMAEVGRCVMERFGDVNVECFKAAADGQSVTMKVWERGVGGDGGLRFGGGGGGGHLRHLESGGGRQDTGAYFGRHGGGVGGRPDASDDLHRFFGFLDGC